MGGIHNNYDEISCDNANIDGTPGDNAVIRHSHSFSRNPEGPVRCAKSQGREARESAASRDQVVIAIERYENRNSIYGRMDDTDLLILNLLRENSRMKNTEIARRVNLTERAVRARIEKLVSGSVIRKFTIETTSIGVEGIVLIDTQVGRTGAVKAKGREMSDSVFECSGEFDVAVRLRADTLDELNAKVDELRSYPGVIRTSTLIKLVEA